MRYVSACNPDDDKFSSSNALRKKIDLEQLDSVVKIVEDKLSMGIVDKRRDFFANQVLFPPIWSGNKPNSSENQVYGSNQPASGKAKSLT